MVRSFRRWYRRNYGRSTRFYRRYRRYRRRYRRFVNGSSRSRVRVKIPVTVNATLTVPKGTTLSNVISITPFFENLSQSGDAEGCLIGSVLAAPLYSAYSGLYDQMKLDGFKLNFSITSGIGPNGTFPSLSVYTAVDRKFQPSDFNEAWSAIDSTGYPIASSLKASSSYLASVALNNSITKMQRSCYASDLFEKANFVDCDFYTGSQKVNGVASQNCRLLRTAPSFSPAMFFAVDSGSSIDSANDRDCTVVIEIMYYVTFRNPKYGGGSSAAKSIQIPYGIDAFDDLDDDDREMDDDRAVMDPPPAAEAAADTASRAIDADKVAAALPSGPSRRGHRAAVVQRHKTMGKNA